MAREDELELNPGAMKRLGLKIPVSLILLAILRDAQYADAGEGIWVGGVGNSRTRADNSDFLFGCVLCLETLLVTREVVCVKRFRELRENPRNPEDVLVELEIPTGIGPRLG
jgi:hypothetical protein